MHDNGYNFWKRVDGLRRQISLKKLAEMTGIKYTRIRDSRSLCKTPSLEDAYKIANYLGCSMEYLLTGEPYVACLEADYVIKNKEARFLVKRIMNKPSLLGALSQIMDLSDTDRE